MLTALSTIEPIELSPEARLSEAERREFDAWLTCVDAEAEGDDHAFDLWLGGELARINRRLAALELQLEALGAF